MTTGLPWHIVEKAIKEEQKWLSSALDFGIREDKEEDYIRNLPGLSREEILRQISISIVSGKIKACEFKTSKANQLWADDTDSWRFLENNKERHGGEWHRAMMSLVRKHFEQNGFEVVDEPFLAFGRADLGVYKEGAENLYVEIGTTTLFKTWYNLNSMPNSILLFVPSVYNAAEFQTSIM